MVVTRLEVAPFPLAASLAGAASLRPILRMASDGRANTAEVDETDEPTVAVPTTMTVVKARKESERQAYLLPAVMSSLGITSMAAAAVYYRFAWQWQMEEARFQRRECRGWDGVYKCVGG
ncbi:beta-carotene hydroxylase 1, chloroplastic-like isoform X2 [Lolium perenne]|uniref:beta-carotene hydroxylase 1, chloroplastic-like isoform X2 n=1 Tax=Lolium perenne TaxID=4522 RepID=UPI0021F62BD8|nr:beta-carotene hydroxylase 1, chloroplastic-like isoform X2 [Lolium perenne]XP_051226019.1 beta-carotene hydroxylase 1, chloroplastic-like isoform X2 [Lolium perenne]